MRLLSSYFIPVTVTVLLHGLLLWWLASDFSTRPNDLHKTPKFIQAQLVTAKPKLKAASPKKAKPKKPKVKPKPKPKKKPVAQKPKIDEQKKQAAAKKVAEEKALALKRKQAEEKKRKAEEEKRKKAEAKKKAEAERKRKEKLAREKAEKERRLAQQLALEEAFEDELEQEALQEQASEDEKLAMSYMNAIQAAVQSNWSRPPSARNGMRALLLIELVPTGAVVAVNLLESSGSDAFDRSAVAAVNDVERFIELQDLPARVFEKYYRRFKLEFKPEDLRL